MVSLDFAFGTNVFASLICAARISDVQQCNVLQFEAKNVFTMYRLQIKL